ncbi:MAG: hypothetical protein ACNI27_13030 [Desulfovibrio sp.]
MTRNEKLKEQKFLQNARPGNFQNVIICPRCWGWGEEHNSSPDEEPTPCRLCNGERAVRRRVTVIVQDLPMGSGE